MAACSSPVRRSAAWTRRPSTRSTWPAVWPCYEAARRVDYPHMLPRTARAWTADLALGWDGEPPTVYVTATGAAAPSACSRSTSRERDNRHVAMLERDRPSGGTSPRARPASSSRPGSTRPAQPRARTSVWVEGFDTAPARGFAARHGLQPAIIEVNRRQVMHDVDLDDVGSRRRRRGGARDGLRAAAGDRAGPGRADGPDGGAGRRHQRRTDGRPGVRGRGVQPRAAAGLRRRTAGEGLPPLPAGRAPPDDRGARRSHHRGRRRGPAVARRTSWTPACSPSTAGTGWACCSRAR